MRQHEWRLEARERIDASPRVALGNDRRIGGESVGDRSLDPQAAPFSPHTTTTLNRLEHFAAQCAAREIARPTERVQVQNTASIRA
jgi:hypothetical protein